MPGSCEPLLELRRGKTVESIHFGSAAIVDSSANMIAWIGDPQTITFLRSSAKPFQALPFIENGGHSTFGLTLSEIALICGSHAGTDMHVRTVCSIQDKAGIRESDLQCGTHPPFDKSTSDRLFLSGEKPSPNRHNCSGKHSGMLAHARMHGLPSNTYLDPNHPVQREILATLADMCALDAAEVRTGIDGCSAPIFAVPLFNAALAFARLCDPHGLSDARAAACRTIVTAMTSHPEMVSGTGRFDTRLMETGGGKILAKGGAEGYQAVGLLPGALGPGSPGIGIILKVSDGDLAVTAGDGEARSRVRPAVTLEILRQLGALIEVQLTAMVEFGPVKPVLNWRKLIVGESRPVFTLHRA